jgi:hypothetical protein
MKPPTVLHCASLNKRLAVRVVRDAAKESVMYETAAIIKAQHIMLSRFYKVMAEAGLS